MKKTNMNIKTYELTGFALDWAVAKAEGHTEDCNSWLYEATLTEIEEGSFKPSTDWSQGGPIIEREGISIAHKPIDARGLWHAVMGKNRFLSPDYEGFGETPLTAAMRCFVAKELGGTVDIPEEFK